MPRREEPIFIWIPKEMTTKYSVTIGTTDVTENVLEANFTRGIIGEECGCEIRLENSNEEYTDKFSYGDDIFFYMDFSDGTTIQFKGYIENLQNKIGDTISLKIIGSHLHSKLLDITVTEEYSDVAISDILKALVDDYLTGYTYTNVETCSTTANIKWSNKPLWDCILDLCNLATYDCYLDNDKDFHFFAKNSKNNDNEAVVWDDTLIELRGIGEDSVDVRNKIIVYGESGGLPVIYTSEDSSSQSTYGVKEKIVKDTDIINESQAEELSDAEKDSLKNPESTGSALCFFMVQLNPSDNIYVISSPQNIHSRYRIPKYTFKIPDETTEVFFSKTVAVSNLFKNRIKKELSQETIVNPYKMKYSYNFTFDDETNIDMSSSSNIEVDNSNLKIISGTQGIMVSSSKTISNTITQVHLLITGEQLTDTVFEITADNGEHWQSVSLNTLETLTNTGTKLKIKITLNSSTARIDTLALLVK